MAQISNRALVFQLLKNMLYRNMKLNDLVSFVRFSLNGGPHIKTSGPINRRSFFSSTEHKVLRVSYCDRPMFGVCRPLSVNNIFKHLLLLNHWANLDETWQGCSLGKALQKLFKRFNSIHNSGCHGNQKEKKLLNL